MIQTLERFLAVHDRVRADAAWYRKWSRVLSIQALTLVAEGAEDRVGELVEASAAFRGKAPFWSSLKGPVGEALGGLAVARGLDPVQLAERTFAVQALLKERKLPRIGLIPPLAATWLGLEDDEVIARALPRISAIYDGWRADHPWITGGDDLLAAVLHALGEEEPAAVCFTVEERYQALRGAGFWRGQALQRAAQIAALRVDLGSADLVERVRALQGALDRVRVRPAGFDYASVVVLGLLDADPEATASRVLTCRDALESASVPGRDRVGLACVLVALAADVGLPITGLAFWQLAVMVEQEQAAAAAI